ncbi:hypothetical protein NIES2100_67280 [Calothrix sp. NIES-2100]|uniref:hypothetical protein n=1 Tax=Calothrix sp. NIES-2100 TaxID=1954172 RepID=UPI000B5ECC3F|nr:hypothetical protein NIES2100_67280 [Calothrix sp. NIES-2100]
MRSQQRLDTLQPEWDSRIEKVKQMREDLAIEAGTAIKFQLEKELLNEETKLAHLGDELDRLESELL